MNTYPFSHLGLLSTLMLTLPLTACQDDDSSQQAKTWPITSTVYTTAEQQIQPIAVNPEAPQINPNAVALYSQYGYSRWQTGPGLDYVQRTELAPDASDTTPVARLLSFFAITDIHISDEESPAQPLYFGWSALYGTSSAGASSAYSPVQLGSTQVLDAAIQTANALHQKTPFDFAISLGDNVNNTQYNELRWFIDVMDGGEIHPSSGAHAGKNSIDYQMPFLAKGLNKEIPWYQVIGNHDQFWMGSAFEQEKTLAVHIGDTVLNMANDPTPTPTGVYGHGVYGGVVDGSTPLGDVIKDGLEELFPTPPTVVADPNRHSLATLESSSHDWMAQFFHTSSQPVGHGFSQSNLDDDVASYVFQPKADLPLKVISLDDTCKGLGQHSYAAACLDSDRIAWLKKQLDDGQTNGELMIIAAHIPINPQNDIDDTAPYSLPLWAPSPVKQEDVLTLLHSYPNLILWISGHRHINAVTPQPYNAADLTDHPELSFWEVETASLRDFPQQFRTFDIRRNQDETLTMRVTNVDPAVSVDDDDSSSPAAKSRGYAIGAARIFGATPTSIADIRSHAYNADLVKQLSTEMQAKLASYGTPLN